MNLLKDRVIGVLRCMYYQFIIKLSWKPGFDIISATYSATIKGNKLFFKQSPFYDIQFDDLDYLKVMPPGNASVFIDAGSYIGTFAIYLAKLSPNNRVFALEPDPDNYQKLVSNISLNKLTNITAMKLGLWNNVGRQYFNSGLEEMSQVSQVSTKMCINTITIDKIASRFGCSIDYIKMDIEGAEIEALQGSSRCIKKYHPKIVVASYHIRDNRQTRFKVEGFLRRYYPHVRTLKEGQLLTLAQ
jgi:FkbM family methyltransferase